MPIDDYGGGWFYAYLFVLVCFTWHKSDGKEFMRFMATGVAHCQRL